MPAYRNSLLKSAGCLCVCRCVVLVVSSHPCLRVWPIVYNLSTSTSHNDPSLISSNLASLSALTKNSKRKSVKFVRKDLNEVILVDLGFGRAPIPLRVGGWGISAIGARTYARGRPGDDRRRWTMRTPTRAARGVAAVGARTGRISSRSSAYNTNYR